VAAASPETSASVMMLLGFVGLGNAGFRKTRKDRLTTAIV